ncbi:hypothetical protein ACN28S_26430 [Cystobacter fuscus]
MNKKNLGLVVVAALGLNACDGDDVKPTPPAPQPPREDVVRDHLESLRGDPTAALNFLHEMPKGADLHSHTSGAITTEKLILWGAEDGRA